MEIVPGSSSNFILYTTPNGAVKLDVFLQDETLWLTQKMMGELFDVEANTISYHVGELYKSAELSEDRTHRKIRGVQIEGKREVSRELDFYNLDIIIAVGYRVNSHQATQFRIWATQVLKEYIIKGFAMNDERLKNPKNIFGKDYFEEQLARIREIRASERRMYQRITDIYSQCSVDYAPESEVTKKFYAVVQNKLHFAITGQTAAEIIYTRADSAKTNMGLTTWKLAPDGKIRESDVIIAKNYLQTQEIETLNRIVVMYLDYAEFQAKQGVVMRMRDWVEKLNAFLQFNQQDILENAGNISHDVAETLALAEFGKYRVQQDRDYISDFDREVQQLIDQERPRKP